MLENVTEVGTFLHQEYILQAIALLTKACLLLLQFGLYFL
jgi:hypothetical protein